MTSSIHQSWDELDTDFDDDEAEAETEVSGRIARLYTYDAPLRPT